MADPATTSDIYNALNTQDNRSAHSDIRRETAEGVSDIRREQEQIGSNVRREVAKEAHDVNDGVKSSAWGVSDRVGTEADRIVAQDTAYFIAGQGQAFSTATSLAALKASQDSAFQRTQADIQLQGALGAAATALAGEKTAAATALGQALIGQMVVGDGNATRALINTLKMEELNRVLTERQTEIIDQRADARNAHGRLTAAQFQSVSSQMQAFQSQLQETRQGLVNFGSMTGSAGTQSSTSNNVR